MTWKPGAPSRMAFTRDTYGRVVVQGRIEGRPAAIMLDSAASLALVNPGVVDPGAGNDAGRRRLNGQDRVDSLKAARFDFGPVSVNTALPHVYRSETADGVIGRELFENAVVDLDFETSTVAFLPAADFRPPPGALQLTTKRSGGMPTVQVQVNDGPPLCVVVDLGSTGSLSLNRRAVSQSRLKTDPDSYAVTTVVGRRSVRSDGLKPARSLSVAGHVLKQVFVTPGGQFEDTCGSLLGVEVLSAFRLYMDIGHDRMWLVPRLGDTFGVMLDVQYRETPRGREVTAVRDTSPAVGQIKVGDVVTRMQVIDSNTVGFTLANGQVRKVRTPYTVEE